MQTSHCYRLQLYVCRVELGVPSSHSDITHVTRHNATDDPSLVEFRAEMERLFGVEKASVSERASYFGSTCWLQYSLEHVLSKGTFDRISSVMRTVESWARRVPTDRERAISAELFRELFESC